MDPSYEEWYIYGDLSEPEFDDSDWILDGYSLDMITFYAIADWLNLIYTISCFISFFVNIPHLFILFQKELRTNVVYVIMIGIALCDIIQSGGKIAQVFMLSNIVYKIEHCWDGYKYYHVVVNLAARSVQIMSRRCSGLLVLYIAAFRAFSVIFPMSNLSQTLMKPKFGFIIILFSGLICSAWGYIFFYQGTFEIVKKCDVLDPYPRYIPYRFMGHQKWELKYLFIDGCIAAVVSILYVIVATILAITLVRNRKRQRTLNSNNTKAYHASKMIAFMAVTVFFSEATYGLLYFANFYFLQDYQEQDVFEQLDSFVLVLLVINSASHVFACFFMSSQYGDTVKRMICGKKEEQSMIVVLESTANSGSRSSKMSNMKSYG